MSENLLSDHNQAQLMDLEAQEWHNRMSGLMAENARIITFRGAGTVNGIDPAAAESATVMITDYVAGLAESGTPVALIYDGDEDNRAKPDVGSVFGGVVDALHDKPNVTALAAQTKSWYYPKTEGGALETATGTPLETYVFPDEMPGSHAALTQSEALADYPGYEQIFVGPAGPIAFDQLSDLNNKTANRPSEAGPVKVTIIEAPNNEALGPELEAKLSGASDDARAKINTKIAQRESQPYGAMFTHDGQFAVDSAEYPGLAFEVAEIK